MIILSKKTLNSLFVFKTDELNALSEEKLIELINNNRYWNRKIDVDINDVEKMLKFIDIKEMNINIESTSDLQRLGSILKNGQARINVDINNIKNIDNLFMNIKYNINLGIKNFAELDLNELSSLQRKYFIDCIYIKPEIVEENRRERRIAADYLSASREIYSVGQYKQLRKELERIVSGIGTNDELETYLEIYMRLGKKIRYPFEHFDEYDKNKKYRYPEDHNLIGPILKCEGVCEGNSKALTQALSLVNIECKNIIGDAIDIETGNPTHEWNQVKINDKWYNSDLTWDLENIIDGKSLEYCLIGDREFYLEHTADDNILNKCPETFNQVLLYRIIKSKEENNLVVYKNNRISKFWRKLFFGNKKENNKIEKKVTNTNYKRTWDLSEYDNKKYRETVAFEGKKKDKSIDDRER